MKKFLFILAIMFSFHYLVAQELTITGKVTDTSGEPIPGVSILLKSTTQGSITNLDGDYSIEVPDNESVLVFSFIGFTPVEEIINGRNVIDVVLEEEATILNEVVVIGYGTNRKQDLSVAVSNISVDESFKGRPSSLGNLLQGNMAGVRVVQSGDPTSAPSISIRGRGNREGDGVLYVVDGVPNAPFNPADIESISVLKDAASAAIYGAYAGSGGVIMITTKQASESTKMHVEVNSWAGVHEAWRLPEVLTAEQFNRVWADASNAAGRNIPAAYDPLQFPYGNITRTNWLDEIFRQGFIQHYDATIRGGSEDLKALASISYDDVEGTLINTYSKKITSRLQVDYKITDWFDLKQDFVYDFNNGQTDIGDGHTGVLFEALAYPRFATVYEYDKEGNVVYGGTVPRWAAEAGYSVEADLYNPVAHINRYRQNNPSNRLFSSTSATIEPLRGLKFNSTFSYDLTNNRYEEFEKRMTAPGRTDDMNQRTLANRLFTRWTWKNLITFDRNFNGKHNVSLLAGYTVNYASRRYNKSYTQDYDFEYQNFTIQPNANNKFSSAPYEDIWEEAVISVLGRAAYSYSDKYFLTASLRQDASSKLNPDNNSDVFPAVSGAWKITSEPFMPKSDVLSFMKLRASWGEVGNIRSVRRFIYSPPLAQSEEMYLGPNSDIYVTGIYQSTIPNPDLKWERTQQTNLGVDLGLFRNSLSLSFDYFNKITKDLIEEAPTPSTAGVESPPEVNIGEVKNYGWEFTLAYNKRFGEVDLFLDGNIGKVSNEVVNLGYREEIRHSDDVNSMAPLRSVVGKSWYSYYLIETDGIFRTLRDIQTYTWTDPQSGETQLVQPNAQVGDLKFKDANNDGVINDEDRVYKGAYEFPDFSYGFSIGARYKGFELRTFWQGVYGAKIYNGVKAMTSSGLKGWNMTTDILDSYEYDPGSGVPRLSMVSDPNGNYSRVSDFFLEKGDYLRLKNLSLSYTLPSSLLSGIGWNNGGIRIYVSGENLITFTEYSSFDPEISARGGIDDGRFPVSRTYSGGINITF